MKGNLVRGNLKKILLSVLTFVVSAVIVLIILFPYTEVATKYINENLDKLPVNIAYETLNISPLGAEIENVSIDNQLNIDTIELSYNPITAIFRRVGFDVISDLFIASGKLKGSTVETDIRLSLDSVTKLIPAKATGGADFNAKGTLNLGIELLLDNMSGNINIDSSTLTVVTPFMSLDIDSLTAIASLDGSTLKIDSIKATGKSQLEGSGVINLNMKSLIDSSMDIKGTVNLSGLKSGFRLTGRFRAPSFKLQ